MHTKIDIALITASDMPKPDEETRLVVEALKDMGVQADVIPWDSGVDWAKVPLVVIRTTWDYFKLLPEFLAWARHVDEVSCLVNPYPIVEWNSHKRYLQELFRQGVPTVPTILIERGAVVSCTHVLPGSGWREVVIKPAVSIGAIGALRTNTEEKVSLQHLERLLTMALPPTGVQQNNRVFSLGDVLHSVLGFKGSGFWIQGLSVLTPVRPPCLFVR